MSRKQRPVVEAKSMKMLPPRKGVCQICAHDHPATFPHNWQTLYYQMQFKGRFGREATWADSIAHCDEQMQEHWRRLLKEGGHWSEPPEGVDPMPQEYRDGHLPPGREG
jgi:hypothetical protein